MQEPFNSQLLQNVVGLVPEGWRKRGEMDRKSEGRDWAPIACLSVCWKACDVCWPDNMAPGLWLDSRNSMHRTDTNTQFQRNRTKAALSQWRPSPTSTFEVQVSKKTHWPICCEISSPPGFMSGKIAWLRFTLDSIGTLWLCLVGCNMSLRMTDWTVVRYKSTPRTQIGLSGPDRKSVV